MNWVIGKEEQRDWGRIREFGRERGRTEECIRE
jgi:hypothetical protein